MAKVLDVAIIGLGARGAETYGRICMRHPGLYRITAVCDINRSKAEKYGREFNLGPEGIFCDEDEFFAKKRGDVVFVCTQDRDHLRHCEKAARLGCGILLEKPLSPSPEECLKYVEISEKYGVLITVCHVLRYTVFMRTVKDYIDSGKIGKLVHYSQIENVAYWHMAHSFVRGNWRRAEETSPMILAKCCHDLDIIAWMAGGRCQRVSSFGSLAYFHRGNMPEGAASHCLKGCKAKESCPYDAEKIYIENFKALDEAERATRWPYFVVAQDPTVEKLYESLKEGPYGRCVFACDNDVVDHQVVNMEFDNGVTATLTMSAFTYDGGRQIRAMGTLGEVIADEIADTITLAVYGKPKVTHKLTDLTDNLSGHGGGDENMLIELHAALSEKGKGEMLTSVRNSVHSHMIAFAAEESRLNGGKVVAPRL